MAGAFNNVRVADTATLRVGITKTVALDASFGFEFDSEPPDTQPQVSLTVKNGLIVS